MEFMSRAPKAALASILSSWAYFGYSFKCLLDAQAGGLAGTALKVAWLSFLMQLGHAIPTGTPHLLALSAWGKAKRQSLLRLNGDQGPTVDIFITYCGEELDVLMDTLRAVVAQDYPNDRYRVIVLDDSASSNVEAEVAMLGQGKNVYYSTRGSKPKTHAKAGNLNHGLQYISTLPGGASDLVAVLDVDMIPSQQWLRALVPHLLADPKVALANPPQRSYNIPDGDPLGQSMQVLFDVMEPFKNATNSAWCCGTGFVVRRDALESIGGVPEKSISEDILTSFYLAAAGWKIVYVHEDLQWGLVPPTITSHIKQQQRSCAGLISTVRAAWNSRAQNMTPEEKYGALFPGFAFAMIVTMTMINLIVTPLILLSGTPLVAYSTDAQLRIILILFLTKFLAIFAYDFLASRAANYQLSLLGISLAWLIPFQFVTLARFALSVLVGGGVPLFTPSGLIDIRAPKTLGSRLKVALWDDGFLVYIVIAASIAVGTAASVNAASKAVDAAGIFHTLFVGAFWPPAFLIWSMYLTDCWIPISYALSPPQPLARTGLLERDPTTQLAYPNLHAKDQGQPQFPPEGEVWYGIPEFNLLERNITVPGFSPLFPDAHCTKSGDVCQLITGESEINAASTITALILSPLFDLRKTYFMVAGIAGINPKVATLGSVTFARFAIQVALQYEFDARSIPANFSTGYVPQGSKSPTQYPQSIYGTEVFEVNDPLRQLAIGFAKTATLNDSSTAAAYRANYASNSAYTPGSQPPSVLGCDVATSDTYFSGTLLGEAFENTTTLFTNGSGTYCTTAQEDNATLEALLRGAINNLTDFSRIIIMRTASDFDRPYSGEADTVNLFYADQGGFEPAIRNIYLAGVKVVQGILTEWGSTFEKGVKPNNYIGDIFGSLGGKPDFGPGSEFNNNPVIPSRMRVRSLKAKRALEKLRAAGG
ncbi:MAG: hypothetical protein Q9181_007190 [Wetmoreana brouardii]